MAYKMQGGVKNYLGNQKMVNAPLKWRSGPQHPSTELAYITKKEKDLLVNQDLHGSLKGGVNRGPSGIMSLNGWGSTDPSQNVSGTAASAAETGSKNAADRAEVRSQFTPAGSPALPPGVTPKTALDFRAAAINAGAGQRVNPGFFDSRTRLSPNERALAKAYRQDPNNRFAKQAYRKTGQGGLRGFLTSGGIFGNLLRGVGQKFGWGKKWNEPTYDMSEYSRYGLGGVPPGTLDEDENEKISETSFSPVNNIDVDNSDVFQDSGVEPMFQSAALYNTPDGHLPYWGDNYNFNDGMLNSPNNPEILNFAKDGGRIGYHGGELVEQETDFIDGPQGGEEFQETVVEGQAQPSREQLEALAMHIFQLPLEELDEQQLVVVYQAAVQEQPMEEAVQEEDVQFAANGGLAGLL
jgi:hypothetical protein